jgi:hypothetical protein
VEAATKAKIGYANPGITVEIFFGIVGGDLFMRIVAGAGLALDATLATNRIRAAARMTTAALTSSPV